MKKIIATIAAVLSAALMVMFTTPPAQAAGGYFYHYSPDAGFDDFIIVTCDWNTKQPKWGLPEGYGSPCSDTDGVWVDAGRQISCLHWVNGVPVWQVRFDATGWHKITDIQAFTCVHQLD